MDGGFLELDSVEDECEVWSVKCERQVQLLRQKQIPLTGMTERKAKTAAKAKAKTGQELVGDEIFF